MAAESSGEAKEQHFLPIFSAMNQEIIQDCKLSKLACGLVLMNANEIISAVGIFQVNLIKSNLVYSNLIVRLSFLNLLHILGQKFKKIFFEIGINSSLYFYFVSKI